MLMRGACQAGRNIHREQTADIDGFHAATCCGPRPAATVHTEWRLRDGAAFGAACRLPPSSQTGADCGPFPRPQAGPGWRRSAPAVYRRIVSDIVRSGRARADQVPPTPGYGRRARQRTCPRPVSAR